MWSQCVNGLFMVTGRVMKLTIPLPVGSWLPLKMYLDKGSLVVEFLLKS